MKKFLVSLCLLAAICIVYSAKIDVSYAKEVSKEKSIEESYKDALNGVSDLEVPEASNVFSLKNQISNFSTNSSSQPITAEYETAQILDEENVNGVKEQTIMVTKFEDILLDDSIQKNAVSTYSTIDQGTSKWDSSYSVQAYSRFYYKTKVVKSTTRGKVTKVTGGWKIADSSVKLSGRKVTAGTSGFPSLTQSKTYSPTSNTFSYDTPTSWDYVSLEVGHTMGVNTQVTLKRGTSSSWTLKLSNNHSGNL